MAFFIAVSDYRKAYADLTADQKAKVDQIFSEAFGFKLSDTLTPELLKTLGDKDLGILYDLDAQNNYWTLNASSGFVLTDKTDLHAGYFFYHQILGLLTVRDDMNTHSMIQLHKKRGKSLEPHLGSSFFHL